MKKKNSNKKNKTTTTPPPKKNSNNNFLCRHYKLPGKSSVLNIFVDEMVVKATTTTDAESVALHLYNLFWRFY